MQENLISSLSTKKNRADIVNNIATAGAYLSMIPFPYSEYIGGASTLTSSIVWLFTSAPEEFISTYQDTEISALKNYSDGKSFDKNCSLELTFATLEKVVGKQNDFATVWEMLLNNPTGTVEDLPDKIRTDYFVTLRWKDENGKTLSGKTIELSNEMEFNMLRDMVIKSGAKNEE